jgi:hypothetical protein
MKSLVSYPDRGPYGDACYRGNCSGHLIADLIREFHPRFVLDPMVGGGTTRDVCRELGVPGWFSDLREGFNILQDEIPVGGDLGFLHPPYHDIIRYSGEVWGREPHPDDLSRCASYEEFLARLNEAQFRLYDALRRGGRLAVLVGDVRCRGVLYPIQRDMRVYGQPEAFVVKAQHNCQSDRRHYAGRFVAIVTEYLWVTRKPDAFIVPMRVAEIQEVDLRKSTVQTWRSVVQGALEHLGGEAALPQLYPVVREHRKAQQAIEAGYHWRAQVRRALQVYPDFESVERGVWRLVPVGQPLARLRT